MQNSELFIAITAFVVSMLSMPLIRSIAHRYELYDDHAAERKVHSSIIPRIGGAGIFAGIIVSMMPFMDFSRPFLALSASALLIFSVGVVDDIRGLRPIIKLVAQIFAALIVLVGGIGIVSFSLPFADELIRLDAWQIPFRFMGDQYNIIPVANLVTVGWIVMVINAINLLDGLDGLAAGVSMIALLTLAALVMGSSNQALVFMIALAASFSLLGFLVSNFYPARIFMGDSGAYLIGLLIAVLPIYSTHKSTIGILVVGLALVDLIWAVLRRARKGKSPFAADRGHLHHRLLDSGIKHTTVVTIFYIVALITSFLLIVDQIFNAFLALFASVFVLIWATKKSHQKSN